MKRVLSFLSLFVLLALVIMLLVHGCAKKKDPEPWEDEKYQPDYIKVEFSIYPETGSINTPFEFDASNSEYIPLPSQALVYSWDWEGDGIYDSITLDSIISHKYAIAGSYNVKLKIIGRNNYWNTGTKNLVVTSIGSELPTVTTNAISDITTNTATCGGEVTDEGTYPVTRRGVCWNLLGTPTAWDSTTNDGDGLGFFVSSMTSLYRDTTYYVRAYAMSVAGAAYGEQISFRTESPGGEPCPGIPTIEYHGQTYPTVKIGDQCWMRDNLNWEPEFGNSWCYDDHPGNCDAYGRLYDWETMMNGEGSSTAVPSGIQGICPDGWHIPSDNEWKILEGVVDSKYPVGHPDWDLEGNRGFDAGLILKEKWNWSSGGGTDLYNFTAKGGGKYDDGSFLNNRDQAHFWSSTEYSSNGAFSRTLQGRYDGSYRYSESKMHGYSVRCIKD